MICLRSFRVPLLALGETARLPVREAHLVFLTPDVSWSIPVDEALLETARAAIEG